MMTAEKNTTQKKVKLISRQIQRTAQLEFGASRTMKKENDICDM